MDQLFRMCENLTDLDISGWENSKVKNMTGMFYDCKKLKT
jgi:surface protein